jgi:class 3 adenylate cyclase
LASRLCAAATDGQILIDPVLAAAVNGNMSVVSIGSQHLKGFDDGIAVCTVERGGTQTPPPAAAQA